MRQHLVIPARLASSRLPEKPLALLHGRPLVERVAAQACQVARALELDSVVLATDSERIAALFDERHRALGLQVVMTSSAHPSGTDRLAEVAAHCQWQPEDIVINLQGDEPLVPPKLIAQVMQLLRELPHCQMATLCEPIAEPAWFASSSIVKVVRSPSGEALYFSRSPIPHDRNQPDHVPNNARRHLGLYAYRVALLQAYVTWTPTPLEQLECLEQLRILEHGGRIAIADACVTLPPGVDTPEDLARLHERPASDFADFVFETK